MELLQCNNQNDNGNEDEIDTSYADPLKLQHELDDSEANSGTDRSNAPIADEAFESENEEFLIEEQYDNDEIYDHITEYTVLETTKSISYVKYDVLTESDVESSSQLYSDGDHNRSLILAAITQLEEENETIAINEARERSAELPYEQKSDGANKQTIANTPFEATVQSDDITQSGDVTTTYNNDFLMDIQAEVEIVDVETTGAKANDVHENDVDPLLDEAAIPMQTKRRHKWTTKMELYLKGLKESHMDENPKLEAESKPSDKNRKRRQSMIVTGNEI